MTFREAVEEADRRLGASEQTIAAANEDADQSTGVCQVGADVMIRMGHEEIIVKTLMVVLSRPVPKTPEQVEQYLNSVTSIIEDHCEMTHCN